ncbi:MAG: TetR/AcrR family transcriptional regulator [Terracidiphilus sp.]|jgi:AcrR family transcriptional regulator
MMFEVENRTQIKRQPRQERSQARFESVLETALRLFAARGYESVSMREIAREAKIPIASVYQYFPMKLAIVREMWTRYTSTISGTLAVGIPRSIQQGRNEANHLVGIIIDRMAELQASNPAFIEIWSCVAASMELRALNVQDTLQNARVIADALQKLHPDSDPTALYDRSLIAIEMASATTRFALALPDPQRARVLLSLKAAVSLLIDPVTLKGDASLQPAGKKARRTGAVGKTKHSGKAATAKKRRGTVKF